MNFQEFWEIREKGLDGSSYEGTIDFENAGLNRIEGRRITSDKAGLNRIEGQRKKANQDFILYFAFDFRRPRSLLSAVQRLA